MDEFFKNFIRAYDDKLREKLIKASEGDLIICPLAEDYPEVTKEIGIDMVEDICCSCHRVVYRSNIKTKAKIICEECFIGLQYV